MITQKARLKSVEQATSTIRGAERSKLESFLEEEAPNKAVLESGSIKEKSIMVQTSNKSNPYLELRRNLELDTSGDPCYSFSLISHKITKEDREEYLGTFGHQEMVEGLFLESQTKVSKPSKKSGKSKTKSSDQVAEIA